MPDQLLRVLAALGALAYQYLRLRVHERMHARELETRERMKAQQLEAALEAAKFHVTLNANQG